MPLVHGGQNAPHQHPAAPPHRHPAARPPAHVHPGDTPRSPRANPRYRPRERQQYTWSHNRQQFSLATHITGATTRRRRRTQSPGSTGRDAVTSTSLFQGHRHQPTTAHVPPPPGESPGANTPPRGPANIKTTLTNKIQSLAHAHTAIPSRTRRPHQPSAR